LHTRDKQKLKVQRTDFLVHLLRSLLLTIFDTISTSFVHNFLIMDNRSIQYMVDFTMPQDLPDEFVSRIPHQREAVNRLLNEGKILNYALSLENSKLWVVFSVASEDELLEVVQKLPLTRYMKMRFSELTFYNAAHPFPLTFSVN